MISRTWVANWSVSAPITLMGYTHGN